MPGEIDPEHCMIEENIEKLAKMRKSQNWVEAFGVYLWMVPITKNHINGRHDSTIQSKELKQANFGSIFNLNMMLCTILDGRHYQTSK